MPFFWFVGMAIAGTFGAVWGFGKGFDYSKNFMAVMHIPDSIDDELERLVDELGRE